MRADYNPFNKKTEEKTEHGTINYEHSLGTVYVTHRRKEHFFKKFQGFGISLTELQACYNKRVYWLLFIYHTAQDESIPFRISLDSMKFMQDYDNKGDNQKIVPLKNMEELKEGVWHPCQNKHTNQ